MNIDKALDRLRWRFQNSWKPNELDVEAYNSIIAYKEKQEDNNLQKNENLAKLWIHQLILLNETKMYDGERSIQIIDEILKDSVNDWCVKLHSKISQMRLNAFLIDKYNLEEDSLLNRTKTIEKNSYIAEKYKDDILEFNKINTKIEDIIKFIKNQINRIVNDFEK